MTNPDELERLARAAEAAFALPGEPDEDDWFMPQHFAQLEPEDAAFISLASPATILALLSANREMRVALERIANSPTAGLGCNPEGMVKIARSALTTQRGDGE